MRLWHKAPSKQEENRLPILEFFCDPRSSIMHALASVNQMAGRIVLGVADYGKLVLDIPCSSRNKMLSILVAENSAPFAED